MNEFIPPRDAEPALPNAYYDGQTQTWWIEDAKGCWMKVNETAIKRELIAAGYDPKSHYGANSECDTAFMQLQKKNNVLYAGGLGGFFAGPASMNGKLILITSSPDVIEAQSGPWPLIESIVTRMFGAQDVYFYGWCKMAYEGLVLRIHKPGQVLVLAGERNSGKSFLQNVLIEALLGGRSGSPYRYMSGDTTFNSDYFGCEHLLIGDEVSGTDIRTRLHFGKELKKVAAERLHSCHRKNCEAIPLSPYWRCTVSLNIDGQNLMVLPPDLGGSMQDKLILLAVQPGPMPMPTRTSEQEFAFREAILEELPGFCAWLREIEIPEELADGRYGIAAWHDPLLVELLEEHSPEETLWALVEYVLGLQKTDAWEGTTRELEELLTTASESATRKIFTFSTACGMFMARLADKKDGRVLRPRTRGWWQISTKAPTTPTTPAPG